MANKGWPDADKRRTRAEKAIAIDSFDPARTLAYFAAYPPKTPSGELRMAPALKASGRRDEANAAVRRAWISGPLSDDAVSRVPTLFPGPITPPAPAARSGEPRLGHRWLRTCRSRLSPNTSKQN